MRPSIVATLLALVMSCASDAVGEPYEPSPARIRARLERNAVTAPTIPLDIARSPATAGEPDRPQAAPSAAASRRTGPRTNRRDSVWNGLLIGAGIGTGGGYIWARDICGTNDTECFAIAAPVGMLAGAGIGAAVGALLDALHK